LYVLASFDDLYRETATKHRVSVSRDEAGWMASAPDLDRCHTWVVDQADLD
jgi:hypothetical protein